MLSRSPIAKIILLASLIILSQAFNISDKHYYDFLKENHKSYCIDKVFTNAQIIDEQNLVLERTAQLRKWIPNVFEHLMEAIIQLCNNKQAKFMEIINNVISFSISYSKAFILSLLVLLVLAGAWVYNIFWKTQGKAYSKDVGPQLTNKTQIFLSIFAVSLLLAISVSIYGISGTFSIQKTLNQVWCSLQKQDNGYLRYGDHSNGTLIDFAYGINSFTDFLTQRYKKITSQLQAMQKQGILTSHYHFKEKITQGFTNLSISNPHLSNLSLSTQEIVELMNKIAVSEQSYLIYFNNTLQYDREVAIGFTYIKGNIDRYGDKFFKMSTISRVISKIAETILVLAILASLISLIAIAYIIYNEQFDKIYYYKPIIQYFLGIICLIGLITAIINSSLVFVTHLIHSTSSYLKNGNIPRNQFMSAGSLNDPLVEIMVSYWPHRSGNMSQLGNYSFINGISQFGLQTNQLNELSLEGIQKQQEAGLSNLLALKKSINAINKELQAIREEMLSPQGLGKLDPRAFGRNIYRFVESLSIHIFNRTYEYRQIFGYLSIFLLMAIISSIYINFSYKTYVRTRETEETENQLDMHPDEDQQRIKGRNTSHDELGQENYE